MNKRGQKLLLNKHIFGSPNISCANPVRNHNPKLRPFRVSVEGNIGAGKSTIINYFARYPGVEVYAEPIEWWRNLKGYNLLNLLYNDIHTWYNVFQKYVQLTRVQIQTTLPKFPSTTTQIFERSVQNNRHCFVEQAFSAGYLKTPEYIVLDQWYQWIESNIDIDIDYIVYLRTTPKIVYERMKNRGRTEEKTVPFEYIKELHDSHERWLLGNGKIVNSNNLLIIDADKPIEAVLKQCEINKSKIFRNILVKRKNKKYF